MHKTGGDERDGRHTMAQGNLMRLLIDAPSTTAHDNHLCLFSKKRQLLLHPLEGGATGVAVTNY
jgi:hypothetical protein